MERETVNVKTYHNVSGCYQDKFHIVQDDILMLEGYSIRLMWCVCVYVCELSHTLSLVPAYNHIHNIK